MSKTVITLKLWQNIFPALISHERNVHAFRQITEKNEPKRVQLDYDYLFDPKNTENIERLTQRRKGVGNIRKILNIKEKLSKLQNNAEEYIKIETELENEALLIPNQASPHLMNYGEEPCILEEVNPKPVYNYKPKELHELAKKLDVLRTDNLGNLTGHRSYFFKNGLAEMEQALINYTVSYLLTQGFSLISVPDLLYSDIIEACGMATRGKRNQSQTISKGVGGCCQLIRTEYVNLKIYSNEKTFEIVDLGSQLSIVGASFGGKKIKDDHQSGRYQVHGFTKVEMFGVTDAERHSESHNLYIQLTQIQKHLFSRLGLHFQILDMPHHELGAPAYTKTDMEAWMPGRAMFGEISSASNCTDYQSRRLNITYKDENGNIRFAHTVNGTACAIPRTIMAICETHQQEDGTIAIPEALHQYMAGRKVIEPPNCKNTMSWIKHKIYPGKIL
ncbi:unnamed protein product, partial [Meganyctiphanes norvegica]